MSEERTQGFTLAEMLVALALLGLMSAYTVSSITTMSQIRRVEARLDGRATVEAVQRHIAQSVSDARIVFATDRDEIAKLVFTGTATELEVVATLNDRLERGGLYRLKYRYDPENRQLLLSYKIFRLSDDKAPGTEEVLMSNVESIAFSYFGTLEETEKPEWKDAWERADSLPQAVSMRATFDPKDQRKWMPLTVRLSAAN